MGTCIDFGNQRFHYGKTIDIEWGKGKYKPNRDRLELDVLV